MKLAHCCLNQSRHMYIGLMLCHLFLVLQLCSPILLTLLLRYLLLRIGMVFRLCNQVFASNINSVNVMVIMMISAAHTTHVIDN